MTRWIVAVIVAALVLPLAACKRSPSGSGAYDPKVDPPASVVRPNIDPNIARDQKEFNSTGSAAPVAVPAATTGAPVVTPAATNTASPTTPAAGNTAATTPPSTQPEAAPPADEETSDDDSSGDDDDTPDAPSDDDE